MENNRTHRAFSTNLAALRGIAVCMVVVFHSLLVFRIQDCDNPHQQSFAETGGWEALTLVLLALVNGHAAVIVFFVLSGVVLTLVYDRPQPSMPALCGYYIKRTARLWPLLAAAAVFALGVRGLVAQRHEHDLFTDWIGTHFAQTVDIGMLARNVPALAALAVTLPLAWLSFVFMERPCQDAGRRIARLIETRGPRRRAATPLMAVRLSTTEPLE